MRLPGDINKMIFDVRKNEQDKDVEELNAWIEDLDQWIEQYKIGLEQTKEYEKKFEEERKIDLTRNVNATKRAELEQEHIEALEMVSRHREVWTSRLHRAEKAKKQAEEQLKMKRDNFLPNQDMFHKWGYTETNSQNKHNPFKIN